VPICDGVIILVGGSQEFVAVAETQGIVCGTGFFRCPDSEECFNIHSFCDGTNQCLDGSDEENCRRLYECLRGH